MKVLQEVMRRYPVILIALLMVAIFMMFILAGCGKEKKDCTAPDGSTITFQPSDQTITTLFGLANDTSLDWTIVVKYSDGTPMPQACLTITGTFAVPNGYSNYQFQYYPSATTPNVAVDSGFVAQTDDYGQYTFSTVLTAGTGTWNDSIVARSGLVMGSATVQVK